ncbi:hypothetical protein EG344_23855 [Chryseobacterium sp. G0162]|nr:hypothetical protein EG344_23855 [Chryseobacterium sp. G0162]
MKRTFDFEKKYIVKVDYDKYDCDEFILGIKVDKFYKLNRTVLRTANDFYIQHDIDVKLKFFCC